MYISKGISVLLQVPGTAFALQPVSGVPFPHQRAAGPSNQRSRAPWAWGRLPVTCPLLTLKSHPAKHPPVPTLLVSTTHTESYLLVNKWISHHLNVCKWRFYIHPMPQTVIKVCPLVRRQKEVRITQEMLHTLNYPSINPCCCSAQPPGSHPGTQAEWKDGRFRSKWWRNRDK